MSRDCSPQRHRDTEKSKKSWLMVCNSAYSSGSATEVGENTEILLRPGDVWLFRDCAQRHSTASPRAFSSQSGRCAWAQSKGVNDSHSGTAENKRLTRAVNGELSAVSFWSWPSALDLAASRGRPVQNLCGPQRNEELVVQRHREKRSRRTREFSGRSMTSVFSPASVAEPGEDATIPAATHLFSSSSSVAPCLLRNKIPACCKQRTWRTPRRRRKIDRRSRVSSPTRLGAPSLMLCGEY
jgi:hypothetical protein